MPRFLFAVLLVTSLVAGCESTYTPDDVTDAMVTIVLSDAGFSQCMFRDMADEPCSPYAPSLGCVNRCCINDGVWPTAPVTAYCIAFPEVDSCFTATKYPPDAGGDGEPLQTGFAYCSAVWGATCGACFDPYLGCWLNGCSYTH